VQRLVDAALVVVAMVIPTQRLDFVQKLTHASAPLVDHETNLLKRFRSGSGFVSPVTRACAPAASSRIRLTALSFLFWLEMSKV
jgi:hypothetical protein